MKTTISVLTAALLAVGCSTVGNDSGSAMGMDNDARANPNNIVRPDAPELATMGDHATGITTLEFINPDQLDLANASAEEIPTYDRNLTVEVWYPAEADNSDTAVRDTTVMTRDAETEAVLRGNAVRDAAPHSSGERYPLIIVSHGYPGNRFLMSHFAENLASKGFVVASIDHQESNYHDQGVFASTLLHRSLDQLFVVDQMAGLSDGSSHQFSGLIDADNTGIIGYSMGGYGAIISVGGGLSEAATDLPFGSAEQMAALEARQLSNPDYAATVDPRIKAAIAIGPWGNQHGFWDAAGLANIDVPVMFMGGSVDDVSDYAGGIKPLYEGLRGVDRYLLTFEDGNHNVAAAMPAPQEVYATGEGFGHYADAVWDNTRMNNIAQHFATAFFDQYLKGTDRAEYLDLIERADAGDEEEGTTWTGFNQRDALGLTFEFELE